MDPSLSPEANRLLERELQQATGRERVDVPAEPTGGRSALTASLAGNRPLLIVTFVAAIVVGGIVSLSTDTWWALVVAVGLHALGTLVAAAGSLQLTTQSEHVSPEVAARLEDEGVADPDRVLTDMVADVAGSGERAGVAEVVGSGHNEQTVGPETDPGRAAAEQRTVMTPTSRPTAPAGDGSAVAALPWWIVTGLMVVSIGFAVAEGGEMWLLPVLILPLGVGWIVLNKAIDSRGEERAGREGRRHTPGGARRRVLATAAAVVLGVVVYIVLAVQLLDIW
jgi:hypothetical protein